MHIIENGQYSLICCTDKKTRGILGRSLLRSQSKKKEGAPGISGKIPLYLLGCPIWLLYGQQAGIQHFPVGHPGKIFSGLFENLIMDLPGYEFDMDDLKELCHLRWGQENAYRETKYPLCLKALYSRNMNILCRKHGQGPYCIISVRK